MDLGKKVLAACGYPIFYLSANFLCLLRLLPLPFSLRRKQPKSSLLSTLRVPEPVPSVADDCEQLRIAFKGWGTNEKLIISILAHRNAAQRKLIMQTYAETYNEDLLKALDRELTNDFERLVVLWTLDPAERDAYLANEATKRWTSSNQVFMEIACTRSTQQLLLARQAYHARCKKSLEEDVAHHTTGDFGKRKRVARKADVSSHVCNMSSCGVR